MVRSICLLLVFLSYSASEDCFAQPGTLDPSFGTGGFAECCLFGINDDEFIDLVVQSDGKIIGGGYMDNGTNMDFALARYSSLGTIDPTFDSDGLVVTDFSGNDDYGLSLVQQSDGKLILCGYSEGGATIDIVLARYNTDGSLDNSFDADGKRVIDVGASDEWAYGVTLQSDGKIVIAGVHNNGDNNVLVIRLNSDGTNDTSFDTDGIVITDGGASYEGGYALAMQSDGKIIVAGYSDGGPTDDFFIARYTASGLLDATFDLEGVLTFDSGSDESAFTVLVQPDNKIIAAGYNYLATTKLAVLRCNSDGSLDNTFDSDGWLATNVAGNQAEAYSIAIQTDDKIVLCGDGWIGTGDADICLVRLNANGSFDSGFDTDGCVITDCSTGDDVAWNMAIDGDEKIVLAGSSTVTNSNGIIARYLIDSTGDISGSYRDDILRIFPNPSQETVTLLWSEAASSEITIFNSLGQAILTDFIENEYTISGLASGHYLAMISSEGNIVRENFVVE